MDDGIRRSESGLRATFSSRLSISTNAFGREPDCSGCNKTFNLLRRRHHCRGCDLAICKDCGQKAIDLSKDGSNRAQWYCHECIDANEDLQVVKATTTRKRNISTTSTLPLQSMSQGVLNRNVPKFCVECGYELRPGVKFCIECGTPVKPPISPVSSPTHSEVSMASNRISENLSFGFGEESARPKSVSSASGPLTMIEEAQEDTAEGSEEVIDAEIPITVKEMDESNKPKENGIEKEEEIIESEKVKQVMDENEHLRRRVEKLKRKILESERLRSELLEQQRSAALAHEQAIINIRKEAEAKREERGSAISEDSNTPETSNRIKVKEHPDYAKFFKLLSMGLQPEQVKMKMQQAGVDPSLLDSPDVIIGGKQQDNEVPVENGSGTLVKNDEKYAKFFKLVKMGMPVAQVQLKMQAEGLDPALLDKPDAIMPGSAVENTSNEPVMKVSEDSEYQKFFKLLKMGMPEEQVKLKMSAAGLNPDYLNNPDAPSPNQLGANNSASTVSGLPPPAQPVQIDASQLKNMLVSKTKPKERKADEPALPKKPAIKPSVELRPLFWSRVPVNVVSSTLWMKLDDTRANVDYKEMEWFFRKNPVDASGKSEDKKKKEKDPNTPQKVLLLDPKRQQNVSIAIARFRMSSAELKAAIYALDQDKLSSEILNVLVSISPTLEEQDLLKNYDGDVQLLGTVETFFRDLLTIPRYTQRIKCIRFQNQFESRILETQAQLDTLIAATDQVTDSEKLQRALEHILAIGNYLNGGTPRGGAYGFKLDTLIKLHTLKSVDPRITLMNFVLKHLEEHAPEIIAFAGELTHISEAKRLSLDQLKADLSVYNSELTMLQGQVRAAKNDNIAEDRFYEVMHPFSNDAREVLEELDRDYSSLVSSYQELIGSFGEDPRKFGPKDFFSNLEEFVSEFKKAYRQNQTKEYQLIFEEAKLARDEVAAQMHAEQEKKAEEAKRLALEMQAAEEEKFRREKLELIEQQRKEEEQKAAETIRAAAAAQRQSPKHAEASSSSPSLFPQLSDPKVVYERVITTITNWATKTHGKDKVSSTLDEFKAASRDFGTNEISADEFVERVRRCVGTRTALRIIPQSATLLSSEKKRTDLMNSYEIFSTRAKQEREDKKKASVLQRRGSIQGAALLNADDIEPVVGEAAQQLHKSILEAVQQAVGGDGKKMKEFTSKARKFGSEQLSAKDFYRYLTETFEPDFVGRLVPDLARLLQEREKRHALIRALCESAPGWEKFAGL